MPPFWPLGRALGPGHQVEIRFRDAVGRFQTRSQRAFLDDVAQLEGNHFLAADRYQKCT